MKDEWKTTRDLPEAIGNVFSIEEIQKSLLLKKISDQWKDLVGAILADHSYPKDIHSSILIVQTSHSAYSQEIGFHSPNILGYIHNKLQVKSIQSVRCQIGPVLIRKKKKTEKKKGTLNGKEELLASLEGITDENLRKKYISLIEVMD
ncbi:DUF721 domain-containing protein [Leptospira sp. GIMC2001]|uniref:DUF721 domain-containing protein n=1 Tax=Leptospira sp. GIMC2001 TaxID=1513297 RepID=UPI002349A00A|nr:DUF721 domain-containing protein [Leptospira sp. GIMC2001]WCL49524.1 DUF721 domain-containing protein [Leptospira sp. GIMC2001]